MSSLGKLLVGICLTQAVLCAAGPPDTRPSSKRPKLGVALAGGAALGLAHIGVLEWMEEHRIPIDYIAGTSMGALVGGLHATGLTSAEIREFASRVDWQQALSSTSPYRRPGIPSQRGRGGVPSGARNRAERLETRVAVRPLGRTGRGLGARPVRGSIWPYAELR